MAMSRYLSKTLTLTPQFSPKSPSSSSSITYSRLLTLRTQSNSSSSQLNNDNCTQLSESSTSSSIDPDLIKLEDAIHHITVCRSAPHWLPFVAGGSYWVQPPRSQLLGIAHLVDKLSSVNSISVDQSRSNTNLRGWPSSAYFIPGAHSNPVESEKTCNTASHSEDEE